MRGPFNLGFMGRFTWFAVTSTCCEIIAGHPEAWPPGSLLPLLGILICPRDTRVQGQGLCSRVSTFWKPGWRSEGGPSTGTYKARNKSGKSIQFLQLI